MLISRPWVRFICVCLGLMAAAPAAMADRERRDVKLPDGGKLTYTIVRPDGFVPGDVYPVILLLPPGGQEQRMADDALNVFDPAARQRGWVVVCPTAPNGTLFHKGAEVHLPAMLADVETWVRPEGNRYHVAGISNGGLSAFRFAVQNAARVRSVVVFPGSCPTKQDLDGLGKLKGSPVRLFVGSDDGLNWQDAAREVEARCRQEGVDVELTVVPTESHIIRSLTGDKLLDVLEKFRKQEGTLTNAQTAVGRVLDDLHEAASKADGARYFALFAPEGVFIGTDATERWTVEQFRAYAAPYFSKGKGWTYRPRKSDRHVDLSPDESIAWFDELLDNDKYGLCRGTGVLRRIDGAYRVCQYHLTVPVPNEAMDRVVKVIEASSKKPGTK